MSTQHTPGPWVAKQSGEVTDSDGHEIAHVFMFKNLALVAEAPELLKALQNLLTFPLGTFQVQAAKAVIAKVTGEQT
ncbi:hypothetical protein B9Z51_08820 [Limnohabitans sp. T6-5]|uniref:hypothetical protein n=1 Tax=Limnohabitans sp. T6-5 TaxID=1100724 RepID=UPI000D35983C|nr:hypothetical protein [Limnohabitans sp. T6-5]PUE09023.1 hypothetical protein B9Z51_08820 [Limnohabitans sp. T6-5]